MFVQDQNALVFLRRGETVRIEAVGKNALRVRATPERFSGQDWALEGAKPKKAQIEIGEGGASITNGRIRCTVSPLGQ